MKKTKLLLKCVVGFSCLLSFSQSAAAKEGDWVYHEIKEEGEENWSARYTCEITSEEPAEVKIIKREGDSFPKQSLDVPETVSKDGKEYTVTAIGERVFANQTYLRKVSLPKTVKTLGEQVFYNSGVVLADLRFVEKIGKECFKYVKEDLKGGTLLSGGLKVAVL